MNLKNTFNDTIQLLKNTFVIIARNPAIFKPTLSQLVIGSILWILAIMSFAVLFFLPSEPFAAIAIIILLFTAGLLILFPFIKMYYRAAQCWIVYHTFKGKNISYKEGLARAKENKMDIFILGIIEIVLNALSKKLKEGTGKGVGLWSILNMLMSMAGALIEEAWDLIGHFLIPGSIIPEKTVGEALSDIKNLKNNVPASLVGVFGIDFAGDMIRNYITVVFMFIIAAGLGIYYFTQSFFVIFIGAVLALFFNFIARIFVDMVKTVYFTIFYVALTIPEEIPEKEREEVTHYLTSVSGAGSENLTSKQQLVDPNVKGLVPIVQQYKSQGYSNEKIFSLLTEKGWADNTVKKAIDTTE